MFIQLYMKRIIIISIVKVMKMRHRSSRMLFYLQRCNPYVQVFVASSLKPTHLKSHNTFQILTFIMFVYVVVRCLAYNFVWRTKIRNAFCTEQDIIYLITLIKAIIFHLKTQQSIAGTVKMSRQWL